MGASFVRPRERESPSQKEARRHSLQKEGFFFQSSNGMKMMSQNPKLGGRGGKAEIPIPNPYPPPLYPHPNDATINPREQNRICILLFTRN